MKRPPTAARQKKTAPRPQRRGKSPREIKREINGHMCNSLGEILLSQVVDVEEAQQALRPSGSKRRRSPPCTALHTFRYGGLPRSVYRIVLASTQSLMRRSTPIVAHPEGGPALSWSSTNENNRGRTSCVHGQPNEREKEGKQRKTERGGNSARRKTAVVHAKRKGGVTFAQGGGVQRGRQLLHTQAREAPRNLDHREYEVDDGADVQQLVPALVSDQLLAGDRDNVGVNGESDKEAGVHFTCAKKGTRHPWLISLFRGEVGTTLVRGEGTS